MKYFIVVTLIRTLVGSVNTVANYELDELTFAIRCLVLGREFIHRAWNISGTKVQPNLRVHELYLRAPICVFGLMKHRKKLSCLEFLRCL